MIIAKDKLILQLFIQLSQIREIIAQFQEVLDNLANPKEDE